MELPESTMPGAAQAWVPREKLSDYLLSSAHPVGGPKAAFFLRLGYGPGNLDDFAAALRLIARSGTLSTSEMAAYGRKYVVDGWLPASTGNEVRLRTVWIVDAVSPGPRLVTAYPL